MLNFDHLNSSLPTIFDFFNPFNEHSHNTIGGRRCFKYPNKNESCEMGLFQAAGLFRSYTNFITAIAQRTKIIKLNHLYLYMMNTLITFKLFLRSIARLLFLFMVSNIETNVKAKKARTLYFPFLMFFFNMSWLGSSLAMLRTSVQYDLI